MSNDTIDNYSKSVIDAHHAEISHLNNFLCGCWDEIPSEVFSDLIETAQMDFLLDHPKDTIKSLTHRKRIDFPESIWSRSRLADAIMMFAYPAEPIDLSLARLAKAARYLGFRSLTPYATAVTYSIFPSLQKEYTNGNK